MSRSRLTWVWGLAAPLAAFVAPAGALDYQVHGFAAQGYALSGGNNLIGDSMDGNVQYFELGVNGSLETGHHLRLSAQELVRRSGELDDGDLRVDYAFADYEAVNNGSLAAGLRAGRVKNPFGLFNETRDVIFTRPSILLPSVYSETQGARSLLFASNGGQLYGNWMHGEQDTSLVVTRAIDFDASGDDKKVFFASSPFPLYGELHFSAFWLARAMNDWNAGRFKAALSYVRATMSYEPSASDPVPLAGSMDFDLYMLSGRYNADRYSLTAEYQLTASRGNFGAPMDTKSDGAYLQADYRVVPHWSAMARLDASFTDRDDRSGDQCTSGFGPADRHECFTKSAGVGVHWQPDPQWGLWGEYYAFDGNSLVPTIENLGRTKEARWNVLLMMAGFRF